MVACTRIMPSMKCGGGLSDTAGRRSSRGPDEAVRLLAVVAPRVGRRFGGGAGRSVATEEQRALVGAHLRSSRWRRAVAAGFAAGLPERPRRRVRRDRG